MKTRIATSLGIALVLVFGIVAVFAALGPQEAQAQGTGDLVADVKVEATPNTPNTVAKWTIQFMNGPAVPAGEIGNPANALDGGTGKDTVSIEFEDDVQFPAAISQNDVTITTDIVWSGNTAETRTVVANPLGVDIIKVSEHDGDFQKTDRPPDETLVTLEIPDMEPADDQPGSQGIAPGALITVVFRQTAGIKNPTESKADEVNTATIRAAVDVDGNYDPSMLNPLSGYKVQATTSNSGVYVTAIEDKANDILHRGGNRPQHSA